MLTTAHARGEAAAGPRGWTAATIDDPARWRFPLPPRSLSLLDAPVRELGRGAGPVTGGRLEGDLTRLADDLGPALEALEGGRGFVILDGVPPGRYSPLELTALYWLVGQALGRPFAQNVEGTLLYDVRDTGQDVAYGARFSVTNAESSFHTDNSFGDTPLDYVGLLCLNAARSGGLSQVVSGEAALAELRATRLGVLEVLGRPFHVDRRGGTRPGEAPTVQVPVVEAGLDGPVFRYLRYWIEAGHRKAGVPLTAEQAGALDALDEVLNRPGLRVEFDLRPEDMYFLNNRRMLHNRTAFADHAEPGRRRHLVRLWLRAKAG
ncbi:MAG TPA: TauD/TfdA family dioxygenase [Gemmataceae bacterium]|jgi:alpha-ketoglutarate-dependent taurine dioxygenase|nr:TauD/TfdA family dioxygenase [Gemmataceae bacterium]